MQGLSCLKTLQWLLIVLDTIESIKRSLGYRLYLPPLQLLTLLNPPLQSVLTHVVVSAWNALQDLFQMSPILSL